MSFSDIDLGGNPLEEEVQFRLESSLAPEISAGGGSSDEGSIGASTDSDNPDNE